MRVANFFEDDYGNIEIVPVENSTWCFDQQRAIDAFSEAHRSGIGWTDVYVRAPVPVPLATRRIRFADLHAAIEAELVPFDRITYEHREVSEPSRTSAYGPDSDAVIFVERDNDLVKELWATLQPSHPRHVDAVVAGLTKLTPWNLIVVDWGWSRVIPLGDEPQLRDYLLQRLTAFAAGTEQSSVGRWRWLERIKAWFTRGV